MDEYKYIPEHERAQIPESDFAGPNRTFPIRNSGDVTHAAMLLHHAADPTAVRSKIIEIARRKGLKLPDTWTQHKSLDMLVVEGGSVKRTGEYKFGGHLVLFTGYNDPDTDKDFFDKQTDFDIEDGDRVTGYYNHGVDVKMGNRKIGRGTVKSDDVGIWLEGQLNERDEYIDAIWEMVEEGKLGLSSGALSHLVRREQKSNGNSHITHWPLGEWSLTPTPAEPRTKAIPLKMWAKSVKGTLLGDQVEADMASAALCRLNDALMMQVYQTLYAYDDASDTTDTGGAADPGPDIASLKPYFDDYAATAMRVLEQITNGDTTGKSAVLAGFVQKAQKCATERHFEQFLRDAGFSKNDATAIALHGYKALRQRDAGTDKRSDAPGVEATEAANLFASFEQTQQLVAKINNR